MARLVLVTACVYFTLITCARLKATRVQATERNMTQAIVMNTTRFMEHDPWVGTLVNIYTVSKNILDIVSGMQDVDIISRSRISDNIMKDLEVLYAVEKLLKDKLVMEWDNYECAGCTEEEIWKNIRFKRPTYSGARFELWNDEDCVKALKKEITGIRRTLAQMELGAYASVQELMAEESLDADEMGPLFELDFGCDGRDLDPEKVADLGEDPATAPGEKLIGRHCRELPGLPATKAQTACVEKCLSEKTCAGFTYLNGKNDEEIEDNRCCFREAITTRYEQEDTSCFIASRARLLRLDKAGVKEWFNDHNFGDYAEKAYEFGLNGVALSALSKTKMQDYISHSMSDETAAQIKCQIDADTVGVEVDCADKDIIAKYKDRVGVVDPFVFFGVKSGNKAYLTTNWLVGAGSRLLSWAQKKFFGQRAGKHSETIRLIEDALGTFLGWSYTYGSLNHLQEVAFASAAFNVLEVASSFTFLVKTYKDAFFDSCPNVYKLLMEENIWAQIRNPS